MVSSLAQDPLTSHPDIRDEDRAWLQRLVGDWQLVADLALADLVLWCPVPRRDEAGGFVALAQVRPFTAPTLFHRDIVGSRARADLRAVVGQTWHGGERAEGAGPVEAPGGTLQVRLWPVVRAGRVIAVVSAHADPNGRPARSVIEENYSRTASTLLDMMQHGRWPAPEEPPGLWAGGTPRVGDGLVVLGPDSVAEFTSPNAVSALRRLGIASTLEGHRLTDVLASTDAARVPTDEGTWAVLTGLRAGRREVQSGGVSLTVRSVPLLGPDGWQGALLLLRDVTELRRQEQRLLTKDATIREIHHRVKNNLQTVGSLLRMQARRTSSPEAERALRQAMQRVDTIALVHQTLSEEIEDQVPVDGLLQRQFRLAVEVAGDGRPLQVAVTGEFGELPSHVTTPLALVLNELAANAVEHGTAPGGGCVGLHADRESTPAGTVLVVSVTDGGPAADGWVPGQSPRVGEGSGLGLRIVHSLVEGDLRGTLRWERSDDGGTRVVLRLPLA
ncbi:histidine kinase N-terminal domain-containing protein [Micrococcus luteus]|uniref:sensor histidine kinase n=1 Tax=Micrococcus luteus TaxID=1270 RepID=UPI00331AEDC9